MLDKRWKVLVDIFFWIYIIGRIYIKDGYLSGTSTYSIFVSLSTAGVKMNVDDELMKFIFNKY